MNAAGDRPAVSATCLYDALNCAALAVLFRETGDLERAEAAHLDADIASAGAFPPGSERAKALAVVLAAVAEVQEAQL